MPYLHIRRRPAREQQLGDGYVSLISDQQSVVSDQRQVIGDR